MTYESIFSCSTIAEALLTLRRVECMHEKNCSHKPKAVVTTKEMPGVLLISCSSTSLCCSAFWAVYFFLVSLLASEDLALPSICVFYFPCCQQDLSKKVKVRLGPLFSKWQSLPLKSLSNCELRKRPDILNVIYAQKDIQFVV